MARSKSTNVPDYEAIGHTSALDDDEWVRGGGGALPDGPAPGLTGGPCQFMRLDLYAPVYPPSAPALTPPGMRRRGAYEGGYCEDEAMGELGGPAGPAGPSEPEETWRVKLGPLSCEEMKARGVAWEAMMQAARDAPVAGTEGLCPFVRWDLYAPVSPPSTPALTPPGMRRRGAYEGGYCDDEAMDEPGEPAATRGVKRPYSYMFP